MARIFHATMSTTKMTNLDKLKLLGESLHGTRWQNAVARDLGINSRQVHRWMTGQYMPHEGHIADLVDKLRERQAQIKEALRAVRGA